MAEEVEDDRNHLNKEFLKDVLEIKTTSHHCDAMTGYVAIWAEEHGFQVQVESCGNVLVTKGQADSYVCLVNHMDTVHKYDKGLHVEEVLENGRTCLVGVDDNGKDVGVGADDKAGCAIAMAVMEATDKPCKAAFFVDEEPGMLGSKATDWEWFKDVKFGLCFDSPERNRSARSCSGYDLFNDKIFGQLQAFALKHGVTKFNYEPYTDVVQLVQHDIPCWVTGNGGYHPHTASEYLVYEDADAAYQLGLDFLNTDFDFSGFKYKAPIPYTSSYPSYGQYDEAYRRSLKNRYVVDDLNPTIVMDWDGFVVCMAADMDAAEQICNALNAVARLKAKKAKRTKKSKKADIDREEDWFDKQELVDRNEDAWAAAEAEESELDELDRMADADAARSKAQKDTRSVEEWMDDLRQEQLEDQNACVDM